MLRDAGRPGISPKAVRCLHLKRRSRPASPKNKRGKAGISRTVTFVDGAGGLEWVRVLMISVIMIHLKPRIVIASSALLGVLLMIVLVAGCEPVFGPSAKADDIVDTAVVVESAMEEISDAKAVTLTLDLPTTNDALFRGEKEYFFQDLDATFPGLRPQRWMGGQYGIVRTPVRTPVGQTFNQVHQGIDIRPVYRDRSGVPLDTVRAIDDGTVVYVNRAANGSNYGRYIVVRHEWDGVSMYSLVAHLDAVWVNRGDQVARGDALARMGYTGRGINRQRAHVHLEVAMLLNTNYQRWHNAFHRSGNGHGLYIGINLRGIDVTSLYLGLQEDPTLTFTEFMYAKPVAYRVALPGDRRLDILERHPWLAADGVTLDDRGSAGSWVISFSREGVPVEVSRRDGRVTQPTVVYVADEVRQRYLSTAGILTRSGDTYSLTRAGQGYMALLATSATDVPRWF
jgi:hypothetical protein